MLILSLFSLQRTVQKCKENNSKITIHHMGKCFLSKLTETKFKGGLH